VAQEVYLLKLFVTGRTPKSERAITNLLRICDEQLTGRYQVEVVDVLERPDLAEESKVLATPTLVKELPPPLRRIIGDLTQADRVLVGLDIEPRSNGLDGQD
jgi:circadian clock protein KaiB